MNHTTQHTKPAQVRAALDLAAMIGEVLLQGGVTNADTAAYLRQIAATYGVRHCHVDLTLNRIHLYAPVDDSPAQPVMVVRIITSPNQDFHRLTQAEELVWAILTRRVPLAQARERIHDIMVADPAIPRWQVTAGWAVLGGGVTLLLGGDLVISTLSMVSAGVVVGLGRWLGSRGLPIFFHNACGGLFAALLGAIVFYVGLEFGLVLRPSMVIATSIIALLAGLTVMQAIHNGVTYSPITGYARFFEAILITCGIVAGVGVGIELSAFLGIPIPPMESLSTPNTAPTAVRVIGGMIASAAFARTCYAGWVSVGLSAAVALVGAGAYYAVLVPLAVPSVAAAGLTSVLIGLIGGLVARRYRIPPVIVAIAGVTPLLPGLSTYRGMYAVLHNQLAAGFSHLTVALATAMALSAGVVLGEWIARRVVVRLTIPPRFQPHPR